MTRTFGRQKGRRTFHFISVEKGKYHYLKRTHSFFTCALLSQKYYSLFSFCYNKEHSCPTK